MYFSINKVEFINKAIHEVRSLCLKMDSRDKFGNYCGKKSDVIYERNTLSSLTDLSIRLTFLRCIRE